ncbi:DoxX family protein [Mammaliicoccus sciuri]|uniref:DoxX family protein n=1 Tax=Mammaliicoccus sciuri TaxID=1296 RepID=UPI001FB3A9D0|nr:DoxX family protein [Mammaliicoccus sciuri]MCJ0940197.1 DoxX family protein [Mammaliicoccus sciuri]MEB6288974.1 DoxX family protein [Mammaliicoccus sciuri]
MLRYLLNVYVGKQIFDSSQPKVKDDDGMAQQFEEGFGLSRNAMKLAGGLELVGSIFLFLSACNKSLSRLGSVLVGSVMTVAAYKHYEAGHGFKGAKHALTLLGLSALSFLDTLGKKK